MNPTTLDTILSNRHIWKLRTDECPPAFDENGAETIAHFIRLVSVADAINMRRVAWFNAGLIHYGKDKELLVDYMSQHGAVVVDEIGNELTVVEAP